MTTDLMAQHRKRGKCSDPVGKCQFRDADVDLYSGCCRPCYDRLRNSNPKNKDTMPDLSPPPQNVEEKNLHKARGFLFESFRLIGATEEHADIVMRTLGTYFRPIQKDLARELAELDTLVKHVPAITEPTDSTAVLHDESSTAQQDSPTQQPQQPQQPQHDSTAQRRSTSDQQRKPAKRASLASTPAAG